MKKITLAFSLFVALFGFNQASAQTEPYKLQVFGDAIYYNMYEGNVSTPGPEGAIRNTNSSYGKKLTDEQIASFGNTLDFNIEISALCDDFDRIGNVNLVLVPKGATSYDYKTVRRIEVGRFITPFMYPDRTVKVPYTFNADNLLPLFRDVTISNDYDFWVELEIYGYQGSATQGGAVADFPSICTGRNDVYLGSLELSSTTTEAFTTGNDNYFKELSYKFELKNYVQATATSSDGTDVLNKTIRTIKFTADRDIPNAKLYLVMSNHGSEGNGEEYNRREHFIYFDNALKSQFTPGGKSCVPYRKYNSMGSCIYYICTTTGSTLRPDTDAAWSWNNWCPGNAIPTRVIDLGNVAKGDHEYRIEVPTAVFDQKSGYFPMSVYVQGYTKTLDTEKFDITNFSISPNPTTSVATINSNGLIVENVAVVNTLGQVVLTGKSENIDLSSLQSGVYMVKVLFDNNQTATQKVIKK